MGKAPSTPKADMKCHYIHIVLIAPERGRILEIIYAQVTPCHAVGRHKNDGPAF